jgi:hypothetical protein
VVDAKLLMKVSLKTLKVFSLFNVFSVFFFFQCSFSETCVCKTQRIKPNVEIQRHNLKHTEIIKERH